MRPSGIATSATRKKQQRGLDCDEDLAAPGIFSFDLDERPGNLDFERSHAT